MDFFLYCCKEIIIILITAWLLLLASSLLQLYSCNLHYFVSQSFASRPHVFVSVKYTRNTKPNDAMYVWLENVNSGGFEVCIREFLPFDGKHQDTVVVSELEVFRAIKFPLI